MKIRGVPESVTQTELCSIVTIMFKAILPKASDLDVIVDRVNHLLKPPHLSAHIPRDVILHLHFFHIKEKLMSTMRRKDHIPSQFFPLQFYADLSQYTLQKRRNLNTIMKALWNHDIRWLCSCHRLFGKRLLKSWQIIPESSAPSSSPKNTNHLVQEWKKVTNKNLRKHN